MSTADRIVDEAVSHRIGLSRYSTALTRKVLALLNRVDADLVARIARADNEGRNPERLEQLLVELRQMQAQGWREVGGKLESELADLAETEVQFQGRVARFAQEAAGEIVPFAQLPSTAHVVAAAKARPFQGKFLRNWLAEAEEGAAKRVREAVRQGFVEGETIDQMVRRIRGSKALQYKDGILEISRRGAEAMVRTAVTHTAAVAGQESFKALDVQRWVFMATLDGRTTLICAGLHGKEFDVGKGPVPPRHVNCRSVQVPVFDLPGLPSPRPPSYQEWLRRQPAEAQNDILGVTKAKLFRSGGLAVDRFTDRSGKVLNLRELRKRDADAFDKAGLSSAA